MYPLSATKFKCQLVQRERRSGSCHQTSVRYKLSDVHLHIQCHVKCFQINVHLQVMKCFHVKYLTSVALGCVEFFKIQCFPGCQQNDFLLSFTCLINNAIAINNFFSAWLSIKFDCWIAKQNCWFDSHNINNILLQCINAISYKVNNFWRMTYNRFLKS